LLLTRARACGALPYLKQTSSPLPEEKVKGLGFVHFFHTTTTTTYYNYLLQLPTTTTYYNYLLLQLLQLLELLELLELLQLLLKRMGGPGPGGMGGPGPGGI
jgi:hypothetical protein